MISRGLTRHYSAPAKSRWARQIKTASPGSRVAAPHGVTVTVTDPVPPLLVAVMVAVPELTRLAAPATGVVMTLGLLEVQVAELVTSVPFCVAVKVTDVPLLLMLIVLPAFEVTVMAADDAPTVTVVEPLTAPEVAVI